LTSSGGTKSPVIVDGISSNGEDEYHGSGEPTKENKREPSGAEMKETGDTEDTEDTNETYGTHIVRLYALDG
jgi:hypothetical protein